MARYQFFDYDKYSNFISDSISITMDDSEMVCVDADLIVEIPEHYTEVFPEIEDLAIGHGGYEV